MFNSSDPLSSHDVIPLPHNAEASPGPTLVPTLRSCWDRPPLGLDELSDSEPEEDQSSDDTGSLSDSDEGVSAELDVEDLTEEEFLGESFESDAASSGMSGTVFFCLLIANIFSRCPGTFRI